MKRKRREFGSYVEFKDNKPSKDMHQECTSYEDTSFDVVKMETDTATQESGVPGVGREGQALAISASPQSTLVLRIFSLSHMNDS